MLNNSGESGHPCLVPDLRQNAFSFSPLRMFAVGPSYYVEAGSFYAHFLKSFNHKWVLNFVKGFFASIEITIQFLSVKGFFASIEIII